MGEALQQHSAFRHPLPLPFHKTNVQTHLPTPGGCSKACSHLLPLSFWIRFSIRQPAGFTAICVGGRAARYCAQVSVWIFIVLWRHLGKSPKSLNLAKLSNTKGEQERLSLLLLKPFVSQTEQLDGLF